MREKWWQRDGEEYRVVRWIGVKGVLRREYVCPRINARYTALTRKPENTGICSLTRINRQHDGAIFTGRSLFSFSLSLYATACFTLNIFFKRFADFQGNRDRERASANVDEYFFGSRHVYRAGHTQKQGRGEAKRGEARRPRRDAMRRNATRRAFLISQRA